VQKEDMSKILILRKRNLKLKTTYEVAELANLIFFALHKDGIILTTSIGSRVILKQNKGLSSFLIEGYPASTKIFGGFAFF